jgi:hypothetical protein
MKRLAVLPVIALLAVAGCDKDEKVPTAPQASIVKAQKVAPARTSVCATYTRKLGQLQAQLRRSPHDNALRTQVSSLKSIVTDTCN